MNVKNRRIHTRNIPLSKKKKGNIKQMKSGNWRFRYYINKKLISKTFDTKEQCLERQKDYIESLKEETF